MITRQAMESIWGADNLIRFDPAMVQTLMIPEPSRRFLADIGLPLTPFNYFRFDLLPPTLLPLPVLYPDLPLSDDFLRFRVLGCKSYEVRYDTPPYPQLKDPIDISNADFICLDEKNDGIVVLVGVGIGNPIYIGGQRYEETSLVNPIEIRFLNSSVIHLNTYFFILHEFRRKWSKRRPETQEEWEEDNSALSKLLKEADPHAVSGWWYEALFHLDW